MGSEDTVNCMLSLERLRDSDQWNFDVPETIFELQKTAKSWSKFGREFITSGDA